MPTFDEILAQVTALLQHEGRVAYRVLKRRFALDDEYIEDLKADLIDAKRLAVDEDGKVLVWRGHSGILRTPDSGPRNPDFSGLQAADPGHWTPPHLAERIRAEQAAMEARGITDGERKTITALFADLKGSTALIEDLDPEEARRIIDPALQIMMDAVHRYEGYVAQSLGDGIFALFGAPIAHEDHAHRALYAALKMQDDMLRYAERRRQEGSQSVQMRVGINTGEVVLRSIRKDDLQADYVPVGHSTNIAARMESLATPGSIVVSEDTHKLTDGFFTFSDLGPTQIKGVSKPLHIYELRGVGPLRTRLQVTAARGLSRFVGRQTELSHLKAALAHALASRGQIVGVMGEPGVGKSRLFYEFKLLAQHQCLILETFSVSHSKAYPYLPLIDLLKHYFQLTPEDDERKRREKVGGKVLMLDRSLEDTLPYLFALLGIAEPPLPLTQMDPQIRKQRTFDAIKRLLIRESLNQPLLLIFEDLHWLDNETQAFLNLFSDSVATAKVLLLVNYRPEYQQPWGNKTYYSQLRLDPLRQADAQELLTAVLGDDPTLQPLKRLILEKTDGNPFFIEEIVQALCEQGALDIAAAPHGHPQAGTHIGVPLQDKSLDALRLPPTVQGVLAARIDRLPVAEKALLQTLAVIGKVFSLSLVRNVVEQAETDLHTRLAHLQSAEFIYEQPAFPELEYIFKHALTQEVAYNSLLLERRKELHERTARAIETLFQSRREDFYEELAHHYSRGANTQKAVEYLQLVGQQAIRQSGYAEAISHLTAALERLNTLPESVSRLQQELVLQTTLAPALVATKGYASQEVEQVYARARELCRLVQEPSQQAKVLVGLTTFHLIRGNLTTAYELGEETFRLGQQDRTILPIVHLNGGATLYWQGNFPGAQAHLLAQHTLLAEFPQPHPLLILSPGGDLRVACLSYLAGNLWMLGYPDESLKKLQEALVLAQESGHPLSIGYALHWAGYVHQFRRDVQTTWERGEALIHLCREHGFPQWLAAGTARQGWVLSELGRAEDGIVQLQQGMAAYQATGAEVARPYYLALLAAAHNKAGRTTGALTLLTEALDAVNINGENMWRAELCRFKGELTLQSQAQGPRSKAEEAEECFLKAVEIAEHQQAKSLELRATVSLARLWRQQDKRNEAREKLAAIYNWFTEGFDTVDLQDAKALLDELGGADVHVR